MPHDHAPIRANNPSSRSVAHTVGSSGISRPSVTSGPPVKESDLQPENTRQYAPFQLKGAVVQREPEKQPDGTFIDPDFPGVTLVYCGINNGIPVYRIVETGVFISYDKKNKQYYQYQNNKFEEMDAPGREKVENNKTGSSSPQKEPPPFFPSIGSFLSPELLARLYDIINIYGTAIVRRTLQAKTLVELGEIAIQIHGYVLNLWNNDKHFKQRLLKEKPALFWREKNPTLPTLRNDYLGTLGEFFDEARLKQRIEAKGETSWVVTHEGGSGETGVDLIIVKRIPDNDKYRYVINCHEDKLSSTGKENTYGYGKDASDYKTKKNQPSGMPEVYRSNYDREGQPKKRPEKLHYNHEDRPDIYQYLIRVVKQNKTLPPEVQHEVLNLLNYKKIDIKWKFTVFGKARAEKGFAVPFSGITKRANKTSSDALSVWMNDMESDTKIADHFKLILGHINSDTRILEQYTGKENILKEYLIKFFALLLLQREAPKQPYPVFLGSVLKSLGEMINASPDMDESPGPVKMLALKYQNLLNKKTSRGTTNISKPVKTPFSMFGTVKGRESDQQTFTNNFNNPHFEGVYQGPSLAQSNNYCGQFAAFNALQLANIKDADSLKKALLNKTSLTNTIGPLQIDIDDLQVREILDKNGGEHIPVLNLDTIEILLAVLESMGNNETERDDLIFSMLNPLEYLALWQFYKGDISELAMVLQTGAEGSNAIDHFIALKLVRSGGKVSLMFLDSLHSGAYMQRLEYLARLLSTPEEINIPEEKQDEPLNIADFDIEEDQKEEQSMEEDIRPQKQKQHAQMTWIQANQLLNGLVENGLYFFKFNPQQLERANTLYAQFLDVQQTCDYILQEFEYIYYLLQINPDNESLLVDYIKGQYTTNFHLDDAAQQTAYDAEYLARKSSNQEDTIIPEDNQEQFLWDEFAGSDDFNPEEKQELSRKRKHEDDIPELQNTEEKDYSQKKYKETVIMDRDQISELLDSLVERGLYFFKLDQYELVKVQTIYSYYHDVSKTCDHILEEYWHIYTLLDEKYKINVDQEEDQELVDYIKGTYSTNFHLQDAAGQTAYDAAKKAGKMKEQHYTFNLIEKDKDYLLDLVLDRLVEQDEEMKGELMEMLKDEESFGNFANYVWELYEKNQGEKDPVELTISIACAELTKQAEKELQVDNKVKVKKKEKAKPMAS
jgi:hypothetical protein